MNVYQINRINLKLQSKKSYTGYPWQLAIQESSFVEQKKALHYHH